MVRRIMLIIICIIATQGTGEEAKKAHDNPEASFRSAAHPEESEAVQEIFSMTSDLKELTQELQKKLAQDFDRIAERESRATNERLVRTAMGEIAVTLEKIAKVRQERRCALAEQLVNYYESELKSRLSPGDYLKILQRRLEMTKTSSAPVHKSDINLRPTIGH